MVCDNCEKEIKKSENYYDTKDNIICEDCIDEHLRDLKEAWSEYLPTEEEVEADAYKELL